MQWVQSLVIILGYLPGLLATETAGVKFATGAQGNILMIPVFFQTAAAIAL
jgi:hypothetical protein